MNFDSLLDSSRIAAGGLKDFATGLVTPSLRLGVTGLSRAGKTVFITALVHALLKGARMPAFEAHSGDRIRQATLNPQPDDDVPRFPYEAHAEALTGADRHWPEGTRHLSQLRLALDIEPQGFLARSFGTGRIYIDIIDYPGEWLLDLALLDQSYAQWSAATLAASEENPRKGFSGLWRTHLATLDANAPADEADAVTAARLFTGYLAQGRAPDLALSTLPPGRFLLPGDLAGSPLLTFAPLALQPDQAIAAGSLAALMERRYGAYVNRIVKPFFFNHFSRIDRQIVLVDVLSALNSGSQAVQDLRTGMTGVLKSFRAGTNGALTALFGRRIDRILFAATKADMLHHESHGRLEAILKVLTQEARERAAFSGASIEAIALASIRATREATVTLKGESLPCIAGIPEPGETIGDRVFDGLASAAIFPGDLPADPRLAMNGLVDPLRFVRFRPPIVEGASWPHIRLDHALEFLLGDRLP